MSERQPPSGYPPPHHVIRDLRMETEKRAVDHALTFAPVQPEVATWAGTLPVGVIATLIDASGAIVALPAATPDWIATADLSYRTIAPVREGPVICSSRLVRAGATIIVVGVEVTDGCGGEDPGAGRPAGTGLMTFSRIPASATKAKVDPFANIGARIGNALPDSGFDRPLRERIGLRVVDPERGVVELDDSDYVRNSFGTINGGVMCMLVEAAATEAALAPGATGQVAFDLAVHYLAQTRTGPARTRARVLRRDGGHSLSDVEVVDAGDGDRLLAMGSVTLACP